VGQLGSWAPSGLLLKLLPEVRLTRIFHTHRDEEAAKADEVRRTKDFDAGLYVSYRSNQNSSPTQHSSAFPASTVDGYEICGLTLTSYLQG